MLCWMHGKTHNKIINKRIKKYPGTTPIEDKIMDIQLVWYGHVMRRLPIAPIDRFLDMQTSVKSRQKGLLFKN